MLGLVSKQWNGILLLFSTVTKENDFRLKKCRLLLTILKSWLTLVVIILYKWRYCWRIKSHRHSYISEEEYSGAFILVPSFNRQQNSSSMCKPGYGEAPGEKKENSGVIKTPPWNRTLATSKGLTRNTLNCEVARKHREINGRELDISQSASEGLFGLLIKTVD